LTELRRPAPPDVSRHDRTELDSGDPILDEWLRRYAGQNRRLDTAATWVIADARDTVVAYVSLAMTSIDRSEAPAHVAKRAPDPVPALLLGRLAVDSRRHGQGIGTALVAHVLATALELNAKAACRAVVVSALHAGARAWWEHLGFHPFDPDDQANPDLYLLTSEIGARFRQQSHDLGRGIDFSNATETIETLDGPTAR
jgi:GNAT superfamily N-acetyltransferase